jgi:hypothetical protein
MNVTSSIDIRKDQVVTFESNFGKRTGIVICTRLCDLNERYPFKAYIVPVDPQDLSWAEWRYFEELTVEQSEQQKAG